jgi:hypothetical protein
MDAVMGTALELQKVMCLDDLLLQTHRDDAIFSVVSLYTMPNGQKIVYGAVPSAMALAGWRWQNFDRVQDYFRAPDSYMTGAEARSAIYANPTQKTFLLYRNIDGLSLIQTT